MSRKSILTCLVGCLCPLFVSAAASAQPLPIPVPQFQDPLLQNLSIPIDAATKGMWSPVAEWPLVAVHAAVTPDGRVVTFGSSIFNPSFPTSADIDGYVFDMWNPRRGLGPRGWFSHRTLIGSVDVNAFCSAAVLLKTGQLLTSGGRRTVMDALYNKGVELVDANSSAVAEDAFHTFYPRYYSTQTVLNDGRVLITGGSTPGDATFSYTNPSGTLSSVSGAPEVYTAGSGWHTLSSAYSAVSSGDDAFGPQDNRWWYPRQWLTPTGTVFGISTHQMWYLDPNANSGLGSITMVGKLQAGPGGASTVGTSAIPNVGATSTAVMYDIGKVLQVGGNGRLNAVKPPPNDPDSQAVPAQCLPNGCDWSLASNLATVIDVNTAFTATTSPATSMNFARQWANSTVLPDGNVLVTGGTALGNSTSLSDAVHAAEIWVPSLNTWSIGASAAETRVYHSTALLLPDGAVLTGGSGGPPNWYSRQNPARFTAEIYYPPYLFQASGGGSILAPRPRILTMDGKKYNYGTSITAEVTAGVTIAKAVLIGLGSTTHGFDMGQRLVPLTITTQVGDRVTLQAPANANIAPPGYYFLFVSSNSGGKFYPSQGVIIAIGAVTTAPPKARTARFDLDGDGLSDTVVVGPTTSTWNYRINHSDGTGTLGSIGPFGGGAQIPFLVDVFGTGSQLPATWDPATATWAVYGYGSFVLGSPGDIPLVADIDGDGRTDFVAMGPTTSMWQYRITHQDGTGTTGSFGPFGGGPQIPFMVDVFNTGMALPATWDPGSGTWAVYGYGSFVQGASGDIPLVGDIDGDGRTDFVTMRPSTSMWTYRLTDGLGTTGSWGPFGGGPQQPFLIDVFGTGKVLPATYDPASRTWALYSYGSFTLGAVGDVPVRP